MQCVIELTHNVHGNHYYFMRFKDSGSELRPVSCMSYRAHKAAKFFPCIADACAVVKQIDSFVWKCRIRPASRIRFLSANDEV